MRLILILCVLAIAACRPIYSRDVANFTAFPEQMPGPGTAFGELEIWFNKRGFAPGSDVFQSESELRRKPGAPITYTLVADRSWWLSRVRTVQDFCVTQKFIYYKLDAEQKLTQAIQNNRSLC